MRFYRQVPITFVSIAKRPLVHEKHPGIKERDAMSSLGMEGGAARRNWATPVAPLAGEGVGKVDGLTNRRFEAADGWGSAGRRPASGAQRASLRRTWLRRFPGLGGGTGGTCVL
jgi:hypothetical protein